METKNEVLSVVSVVSAGSAPTPDLIQLFQYYEEISMLQLCSNAPKFHP